MKVITCVLWHKETSQDISARVKTLARLTLTLGKRSENVAVFGLQPRDKVAM